MTQLARVMVDDELIGAVRAAALVLDGLAAGEEWPALHPDSNRSTAAMLRELVADWTLAAKETA